MLSPELEFAITQYLDGALAPQAKAEVEQLLRDNPQAQALLDEYRKLDALIVSAATPLPNVDWPALSKQIAAAVALADRAEQSARVYRIGWVAKPSGWLALAASLLIAIGATVIVVRSRAVAPVDPHMIGPMPVSPVASAQVIGPRIEVPAGSSVAQVTVSRPPLAMAQDAQDIVARRSHINIEAMAVMDRPEFGPH